MNQQATRRKSVTGQGAVGVSTRVVLGLTILKAKAKHNEKGILIKAPF